MTQKSGLNHLHVAETICQTLAQAGTPVQLRGIRQEAYETHFVLSPGSGQNQQTILRQAALIKRTVNRCGTRVRRNNDDVLVIVTHDFELLVVLNFLIPLCVPSLLVLNIAAVERGLRILFGAAPDVLSAAVFTVAVIVLDACLAYWLPGLMRRSRAHVDRKKAKR